MNVSNPIPPRVCFATFEVDFESRELRRKGVRLRIEDKPFQILRILLERPGRVVSRKLLCERLWPDTHVGYQQSLNTAVSKLRELLGDSARNPRFIETLPRVGYRFIAPISKPRVPFTSAARTMLAVLPFQDLCGDREQQFFADGLTEELISRLGQLDPSRLGVIARTAASQYKSRSNPIQEISADLNVAYVLEGTVRCAGEHVRITAQLIETQSQVHQWNAIYDRDLCDALEVQSDVARQVGDALAAALLPASGATGDKTLA